MATIEAKDFLNTTPGNEKTLFTRRTSSLLGVQIIGCGSYLPEQIVTNDQLDEKYGCDPNWIVQRTGIIERRHCPPGMATSDMCIEASRRAIRSSGIDPQQVDLLVCGTFTPDYHCPSTACLVQDQLGLDCPAFDTAAACAGFMYALVTASQFVATGNAKYALAVGGDLNSRIVNPQDQRTFPLFGDGAGAVLITRGSPHQGLICYQLGSDGSGGSLLDRPAGGTKTPLTAETFTSGEHFLRMDGRSVFKWAVRMLADTVDLVLEKSGMTVHDISQFVLHQANIRIISAAAEQLGIPQEKLFVNLERYGNTSAGSIPIALDEAFRAGKIKRGDAILLCGFGAGLTWGTGVFRW